MRHVMLHNRGAHAAKHAPGVPYFPLSPAFSQGVALKDSRQDSSNSRAKSGATKNRGTFPKSKDRTLERRTWDFEVGNVIIGSMVPFVWWHAHGCSRMMGILHRKTCNTSYRVRRLCRLQQIDLGETSLSFLKYPFMWWHRFLFVITQEMIMANNWMSRRECRYSDAPAGVAWTLTLVPGKR
jgi:hypothetical protein